MKSFYFLVAVVMSVLLCGCDKILPAKKNIVKTEVTKEEATKIGGPLLARVNNWAIGLQDFRSYLDNLKPLAQAQGVDVESYEFKARLLNDLVKNEILAQIATDRGLDKNEDMAKALRDTKSTLLASKMRSDFEKTLAVTDAELQSFYDQNKALLKKPQERKLKEIVLTSESVAKDIYIRLLQGEDFAALAKQYSTAESAGKGGDLGYVVYDPQARFQKFWETTLSLEKGEISSIFKSDDGKFYIVKADDVRGGQEIPLTEVKEELKTGLKRDKIEKEITNLVDKFKLKAKVEVNEDLIK